MPQPNRPGRDAGLENAVCFEDIHNFFHQRIQKAERRDFALETLYGLETFEEQLSWAESLAELIDSPQAFDAEVQTLYDLLYI